MRTSALPVLLPGFLLRPDVRRDHAFTSNYLFNAQPNNDTIALSADLSAHALRYSCAFMRRRSAEVFPAHQLNVIRQLAHLIHRMAAIR
jgi:hypothetical protein